MSRRNVTVILLLHVISEQIVRSSMAIKTAQIDVTYSLDNFFEGLIPTCTQNINANIEDLDDSVHCNRLTIPVNKELGSLQVKS